MTGVGGRSFCGHDRPRRETDTGSDRTDTHGKTDDKKRTESYVKFIAGATSSAHAHTIINSDKEGNGTIWAGRGGQQPEGPPRDG